MNLICALRLSQGRRRNFSAGLGFEKARPLHGGRGLMAITVLAALVACRKLRDRTSRLIAAPCETICLCWAARISPVRLNLFVAGGTDHASFALPEILRQGTVADAASDQNCQAHSIPHRNGDAVYGPLAGLPKIATAGVCKPHPRARMI